MTKQEQKSYAAKFQTETLPKMGLAYVFVGDVLKVSVAIGTDDIKKVAEAEGDLAFHVVLAGSGAIARVSAGGSKNEFRPKTI